MVARFAAPLLIALVVSAADASPTAIAVTERFEFHSDPWLNAHHFLYQWSRADLGLGEGRRKVDVPERASLSRLADGDREAWDAALEFYRNNVAELNHFNNRMLDQKAMLLRLRGDTDGVPEESIEGISKALQEAMPVYLEYWWPAHAAGNRAWVDAILPLLKRHEGEYVVLMTRLYASEWADRRRRVDVSAYANYRAGYTARAHTVMYSSDPGNQDLYGLEMLLHEIQHAGDVAGRGRETITLAFSNEGFDTPPNLWHAMIFLTAGSFVQTVAEAAGLPPHVPYWEREGFREFNGWRQQIMTVEKAWLPAVRGEVDPADAYTTIAAEYPR